MASWTCRGCSICTSGRTTTLSSLRRGSKLPWVRPTARSPKGLRPGKDLSMKWVTREKARVDRIACPWLITRFIDKEPTFLFVPARDVLAVAKKEDAIPYDVPDVELGHHGDQCSFDAFVDKYKLTDPALRELALIVRGADTDARALTPESAG